MTVVNKIYLTQRTHGQITKRLSSSVVPATYDNKYFGTYDTSGLGLLLSYPNGIAIDAEKKLYVCDTKNNRIVKFESDVSIPKLSLIGSYDTSSTIGQPFGIMYDNVNDVLYIVGVYNNLYTRVEKISTSLTSELASGNLHAVNGKIHNPIAIVRGFTANSLLVCGANLDIYETIETSSFSSFITRSIIGNSPTIYYGAIMGSNGYLYLNNGQKILKVNSMFTNIGKSNRISKLLYGLKESNVDQSILTCDLNAGTIFRYNENLNFVETIYTGSGNLISNSAYDVMDYVEDLITLTTYKNQNTYDNVTALGKIENTYTNYVDRGSTGYSDAQDNYAI